MSAGTDQALVLSIILKLCPEGSGSMWGLGLYTHLHFALPILSSIEPLLSVPSIVQITAALCTQCVTASSGSPLCCQPMYAWSAATWS